MGVMTDTKIEIYTDGGYAGRRKVGGAAMVALDLMGQIEFEKFHKYKNSTSQRMELQAMIWALQYAAKNKDNDVVIYSDSQYCTRGINEWMEKWKMKDWRVSGGKDRINSDQWQKIYKLWQRCKKHTEVKWVKGHDGNEWNEYVDLLATTVMGNDSNAALKSYSKDSLVKSERLFDTKDLVALDYPKSSYNRFKLEDVTQLWLCISKINKFLSMEFTSADIKILKRGRPICKSELDKSITRTMHDVLWKYFKRHFVIDLIER